MQLSKLEKILMQNLHSGLLEVNEAIAIHHAIEAFANADEPLVKQYGTSPRDTAVELLVESPEFFTYAVNR